MSLQAIKHTIQDKLQTYLWTANSLGQGLSLAVCLCSTRHNGVLISGPLSHFTILPENKYKSAKQHNVFTNVYFPIEVMVLRIQPGHTDGVCSKEKALQPVKG